MWAFAKVFLIASVVVSGLLSVANAESVTPPQRLSLTDAIERALAQSPEVKAAESRKLAASLHRKLSLSPFLPTFSLETGYQSRESQVERESGTYLYGVGRLSLFNGGRDWIERRLRKSELTKAEAELTLARASATREVARYFVEALFVREALRLKSEALESNAQLSRVARRKAQGGVTSSADVLEFEFRENALKTELILLEHERDHAVHNLQLVLGIPIETPIAITSDLNETANSLGKLTADGTLVRAPLERLALVSAEDSMRSSELRYKGALATWLPSASLEGQYGDLRFADPEIAGRPAWMISFNLSIPLFSGLETLYSRQLGAESMRENEATLRLARLRLENQIHHQEEKLRIISRLLALQKDNIGRAEKFFRATVSEYQRGVRNAPDVTGASETYFHTQLRSFELVRDKLLAELGLTDGPAQAH